MTGYKCWFGYIAIAAGSLSCGGTNVSDARTQEVATPQSNTVGGDCDGCELMYLGMPDDMSAVDTSTGWREEGKKLLVRGTIYKKDGVTPAPGVILYYWHTDHKGYYSPAKDMDENVKRHGHIRGWLRTDQEGRYALYTIRPGCYPNEAMPAHIHLSVKEPGIANEYYVDELVFDDDAFLTPAKRKAMENRGGSGILKTISSGDLLLADHNIILGLNIPGYPQP